MCFPLFKELYAATSNEKVDEYIIHIWIRYHSSSRIILYTKWWLKWHHSHKYLRKIKEPKVKVRSLTEINWADICRFRRMTGNVVWPLSPQITPRLFLKMQNHKSVRLIAVCYKRIFNCNSPCTFTFGHGTARPALGTVPLFFGTALHVYSYLFAVPV